MDCVRGLCAQHRSLLAGAVVVPCSALKGARKAMHRANSAIVRTGDEDPRAEGFVSLILLSGSTGRGRGGRLWQEVSR